MSSTLITLAPTGAETAKADAPALPVTLEELVSTAKAAQSLGAAVIHVHVRDDRAQPTLDLPRVRDSVDALRAETDLIVQLSTGGAISDSEADRLRVLDAGPDSASCTMGTVNFGRDVFTNRWDFIVALHEAMQERRIVPEYEIFDLGQLATLQRLLDRHGLPYGGRVHCDLVMGVPGGMPGRAETLVMAASALPSDATFSATGVGRTTLPVMLASLAAGGHLRVGMEDTLTWSGDEAVQGNEQLVQRAAELAALAQRPPMTPAEARGFLGMG
jgi:3-keto-5-aminohexanoate cleavage enzyme